MKNVVESDVWTTDSREVVGCGSATAVAVLPSGGDAGNVMRRRHDPEAVYNLPGVNIIGHGEIQYPGTGGTADSEGHANWSSHRARSSDCQESTGDRESGKKH